MHTHLNSFSLPDTVQKTSQLIALMCSIFLTSPVLANPHLSFAEGVLLESDTPLDPALPPGANFELIDWHLTLPLDTNKDGKADTIGEINLHKGFQLKPVFFTTRDGGMSFVTPNKGATTSKNTKYVRTELREMLRRGNRRIKTQGVNKNNWVFGSMHSSGRRKAGGIGGTLEATLAVNRVSETGEAGKVGRVIIGQIHAVHDEPLRLYYRKLPGNDKGSVYFAHEINDGEDIWTEMVGTRSDSAPSPIEGIQLNEKFSYVVTVEGDHLYVTLIRNGKPNITRYVDMVNSGYHQSNQYMYFKAGVYNQNNGGEKGDYAQATFYHLRNRHSGYEF